MQEEERGETHIAEGGERGETLLLQEEEREETLLLQEEERIYSPVAGGGERRDSCC